MFKLNFRVYGILNDYLPFDMRYRFSKLNVIEDSSVSNLLSFHGIPKKNINLITVNDEPVAESYKISPGDIVSIYPKFKNIDKDVLLIKLREKKKVAKFLIPIELKDLAYFLARFGFDIKFTSISELENNFNSNLLIERVVVLLKGMKKKFNKIACNEEIYYMESTELSNQVKEILHKFVPDESNKIFGHCVKCEKKFEENERRNRVFNLINRSKTEGKCLKCRRRLNTNSNVNFLN